MKVLKLVYLTATLLLLSSCTSATKKQKIAEQKAQVAQKAIDKNDKDFEDKGRAYVYGTQKALSKVTNSEPAVRLAQDFSDKAMLTLGPPSYTDATEIDKIIVGLLSSIDKDRADAKKRQDKFDRAITAIEADKQELKSKLDTALKAQQQINDVNAEKAAKYDEEHRQNIIKRVWHWAIATLGIGGIIALCVFCPALIPVFGRIVAWIVGKIPSLAGAIGVASTKVVDGLVKGVGDVRCKLKLEQAKPEAEQAKYSPADVQKMIDDALLKSTDDAHRSLIDQRRDVVQADLIHANDLTHQSS